MSERVSRYVVVCFTLILTLAACDSATISGSSDDGDTGNSDPFTTGTYNVTVAQAMAEKQVSHEADTDYTWETSQEVVIKLGGNTAMSSGPGVSVSGDKVTVTSAGTYRLSGSLTDGQVVVNTTDTEVVRLVLGGVDLRCSTSAPLFVKSAEKVIVFLADHTTNKLEDGSAYVFPSADVDEPNAVLFSTSDLSIAGSGSLTVKGNFNDGIASKDGLVIANGTIAVSAVDDGIRGKDYLIVKGGNITVSSSGDGLKADNDEEADRGYVLIENGDISVVSVLDAVTAETDVLIKDGTLNLVSGGGSTRSVSGDISAKGLKGLARLIVDGGEMTINSADDAVHTNGGLAINGGTLVLSAADDGIHADSCLGINGGAIDIIRSYEGIESNVGIAVSDGVIHLTSSDDGINAASGNGEQFPGQSTGIYYFYMKGGNIVVNASGDGLDVNGTIVMTGGDVIVHGPISNANAAVDYDRSFTISGGFLVAAGSAGMAQAPGTSSSQYSVLLNFSTTYKAGTLIHIQDGDGNDVLSFAPAIRYQSIVFSSDKLVKGTSYSVFTGGTYTGTLTDGLYVDGSYSPGSQIGSFTLSSISSRMTI